MTVGREALPDSVHEKSLATAGLRSILIVAMNYHPEPTGIARYVVGLAEMASSAGAAVEVVTGVPHYPSWTIDARYRWRPRFREMIGGLPVKRLRHFVPAKQSAARRAVWEATFTLNGLANRPASRPDAIVAFTPCLGAGVVAARYAAKAGVPLGVIVQDLTGQAASQSGIVGGAAVSGIASSVERWTLRRADSVAIVSEGFRQQLSGYGIDESRIQRLPNWTHIPDPTRTPDQIRAQLSWDHSSFVVLHSGNMGLKQDLGNVIEAARLIEGQKDVLFILLGHGNQRANLKRQAADLSNLRFVDPLPDEMYSDVLAAVDVLLVNELPNVGEMSLPSKLTSYLASARPVIAAVGETGAAARELTRATGASVRVDPGSPTELAAAIMSLKSMDPAERAAMGFAGKVYAEAELTRSAASKRAINWLLHLQNSAAQRVSIRD
ncbi:glycosyltransferase family 4 protein [Cryptosporangium sp. NPDC048952]|uniref:glycosyltransferase family 4 protein n=1 Tax=Cryptosporangium sp. NPDC048952 TaxID=3363961 RepID=UPI00371CF58F